MEDKGDNNEKDSDLVVTGSDSVEKTKNNETIDLESAVEEMPPDVRRVFMSMAQSTSFSRRMVNPLFDKFTDEHIHKYLDYIQRDDDNAHELAKSNRKYYLAYFIISLIVFGAAVVFLLPNNQDFLEYVITFLIAIAGGIGTGYGLKTRND